jgi:hypothetical protein
MLAGLKLNMFGCCVVKPISHAHCLVRFVMLNWMSSPVDNKLADGQRTTFSQELVGAMLGEQWAEVGYRSSVNRCLGGSRSRVACVGSIYV